MRSASTRWLLACAAACVWWAPVSAGGSSYRNFDVFVRPGAYSVFSAAQ